MRVPRFLVFIQAPRDNRSASHLAISTRGVTFSDREFGERHPFTATRTRSQKDDASKPGFPFSH
jgi:hypothetical protein